MTRIDGILKTQTSKMNFLKGLVCIAKADESIKESEKQFFIDSACELGLMERDLEELNAFMESKDYSINIRFTDKSQALLLLREGLQLCLLDGKYCEAEKRVIEKIGSVNGISVEEISSIEDWVQEGLVWREKGDALLNLEGYKCK